MDISVSLIDVCYACYLTDHHNRPGEFLLASHYSRDKTVRDVMEDVISEFEMTEHPMKERTTKGVIYEIKKHFEENYRDMDALFFGEPEEPEEPDGPDEHEEVPMAWFLVKLVKKGK